MIITLFFTLLASVAIDGLSLGKRGLCPLHYVQGPGNQCFRFSEDRKNFNEAKSQCESEGGSLANTQNGDAYNFVRQHIESSPAKANVAFGLFGHVSPFTPWRNGWFVGAQKNGGWHWFNGQSVEGRWVKSMPDNAWGREGCLQQMSGDHGWNDIPCGDRLRFVCQRNILDPCAQTHCGNGRCVHRGNGVASCVCSAGWRGSNCGERIDYCASVHCGNGRCVAPNGVASCVCHAGWTGSRCSQKVVVDPCAQRPCQNGGDCFSNQDGYFCKCRGNFKGVHCEKSCRFAVTKAGLPTKLDATILFDGSLSVGPTNFKKSLEFITRFVDKLDIGNDKARVEIVQFSHKIAEALSFAESTRLSKAALRAKVAGIGYLKGGTATGKAMTKALEIFHGHGRQASDVAKYLVVLTDGNSADREHVLIRQAVPKLRAMGVELVAVGVGSSVNDEELQLIAGGKAANVFSVDSFDQLDSSLISKMVEKLCD